MVKTNFSQNGIGRSLLEPFYIPFSRLMKRQISDGAFALGARLAGREGVVSSFCPDPLPWFGKPCSTFAVAMLKNVHVAAAGLLAQKSLARDLTFGAIK